MLPGLHCSPRFQLRRRSGRPLNASSLGASMNRQWKALGLSFLLPGAGLWYLGWRWSAVANLVVVVVALVALRALLPDGLFGEHFQLIYSPLQSGSAGLAYGAAIGYPLAEGGSACSDAGT